MDTLHLLWMGAREKQFGNWNEASEGGRRLNVSCLADNEEVWRNCKGVLLLYQPALSTWAQFQRDPPVGKSCKGRKTCKPFQARRLAECSLTIFAFSCFGYYTGQESFCGLCVVKTDIKQLELILCISPPCSPC